MTRQPKRRPARKRTPNQPSPVKAFLWLESLTVGDVERLCGEQPVIAAELRGIVLERLYVEAKAEIRALRSQMSTQPGDADGSD